MIDELLLHHRLRLLLLMRNRQTSLLYAKLWRGALAELRRMQFYGSN